MATPLWLALLKEAASGTTPTTANDTASGTPVNLTLTFAGSDSWTSIGSGNGVTFTAANQSRGMTADTSGTKIQTAIQGSTTITGEFVANATVGCALSLVDTGNDNQAIACFFASAGTLLDCYAGSARYIFNVSTGLHRYHLVVDSNAAAGSRLILYQDGSAASVNVLVSELTAASAVDSGMLWGTNPCRIGVGTFDGFSDWLTGSVYEAAIYTAALSSGQVSANQTALGTNNDADPNGGGALPFAPGQDASMFARAAGRPYSDPSAIPLPTVQKKAAWIADPPVIFTKASPRPWPPMGDPPPLIQKKYPWVAAPTTIQPKPPAPPVRFVDDPLRPLAAAPLTKWSQDVTIQAKPQVRPYDQSALTPTAPVALLPGWPSDPAPRVNGQAPLRMPRNTGGIPSISPWAQEAAPVSKGQVAQIRAESAVGIRPLSAAALTAWTERQGDYPLPARQAPPRVQSDGPIVAIQAGLVDWTQDVTTIVPARSSARAESSVPLSPVISAPVSLAWASDGQAMLRAPKTPRSDSQPPGVLPAIAYVFRGVIENSVVRWFRSKFQPASAEVLAPLIPVIIPPFEPGPLDIVPADVVLTIWEANV